MKLTEKHQDDLLSSGLSDEIIQASGIYSIDRLEAKDLLGFDPKCSGMIIPYPGTDFIRFKPDTVYQFQNGRKAKYLQAKNSENHLFIPPLYPTPTLGDSSIPVILTEGEKKALKGAQELSNYLVIGLAGVWSFKSSNGLLPDFDRVSWSGREVFIVFDSDATTNPSIQKAEQALITELQKKGGNTYVCRILFE